mgnify:CR=1 FL=1
MKFGSVCSGIEAASLAFNPLGWDAAWFAEIEPSLRAALAAVGMVATIAFFVGYFWAGPV